jgi:Xaa-Pro dipeptidase
MSIIKNNVSRLQVMLRKSNIDCVIVPLGINFRWLFNSLEEPSERLLVGIIDSENPPQLLVPTFEVERIKKMTGVRECIGWDEMQDPYDFLSDIIPERSRNLIGIEPKMWFSVYNNIFKVFPNNKFINAESIFIELRAVKDKEEQNYLAKASQKSGDAIVDTFNELEVGISESEVKKILVKKLTWGPREKAGALVQFGDNSAFPHYHGGETKLKKDNVVLIDAGGTFNNYWGDITITTVFGKASRRFKEIYDIVFDANVKGKESAAQNNLPCEVDNITRNHITKKGYGEYFTHRTGHGIGLEVHEHPYIVGNNQKPLIPGNAFTVEPGIYLPGEFGVRIEDDVIKTSTGIETSKIPRYELIEI